MVVSVVGGQNLLFLCKEPTQSIRALFNKGHAHSFIISSFLFLISEVLTPLETRSLVRRRLALGGSHGSCRVTGNCRPATGKTQQRQVDVCHLRRPESGQVRTRGRTRLDRSLVVVFSLSRM